MQKKATSVFKYASIAFGILGILNILTMPADGIDAHGSDFNKLVMKLMFISVFIILPSFALSIASKYLSANKS